MWAGRKPASRRSSGRFEVTGVDTERRRLVPWCGVEPDPLVERDREAEDVAEAEDFREGGRISLLDVLDASNGQAGALGHLVHRVSDLVSPPHQRGGEIEVGTGERAVGVVAGTGSPLGLMR